MNEHTPEAEALEIEPRGKLAASVAAVMKEVKRLEKADNNAFARYKFTSVDDYKDSLRRLMAANGLEPCLSEIDFSDFVNTDEKGKEKRHLRFKFELWLRHSSGEVGEREGSTVCLPYVGAQSTGQARSYAQKEWLKSKFLASSGDMAEDADSGDLDIKLPKAQARAIQEKMDIEMRAIGDTGTKEELKSWYDVNEVLILAMPNDWIVNLRSEYNTALLTIKAREKGADVGPELPIDLEAWLSDLAGALGDCITAEELTSAWSEAQAVALALPAEESQRAFAMLEKNKKRFVE